MDENRPAAARNFDDLIYLRNMRDQGGDDFHRKCLRRGDRQVMEAEGRERHAGLHRGLAGGWKKEAVEKAVEKLENPERFPALEMALECFAPPN